MPIADKGVEQWHQLRSTASLQPDIYILFANMSFVFISLESLYY
jgi:hypothetical protein